MNQGQEKFTKQRQELYLEARKMQYLLWCDSMHKILCDMHFMMKSKCMHSLSKQILGVENTIPSDLHWKATSYDFTLVHWCWDMFFSAVGQIHSTVASKLYTRSQSIYKIPKAKLQFEALWDPEVKAPIKTENKLEAEKQ